jgi:predicted glutamine amidotransferase
MARLVALVGNRSELTARVLHAERDALLVRVRTGLPLGWGLGFYQGDEVLMRRRPVDDREPIDLAFAAADVRADVLIGHVRSATVGALRTENTHPFRFRQWLFAQTGTIPLFDTVRDRLLSTLPDFLRAQIRGETDAEVFFHVFLSFLHDRGALEGTPPPSVVREALRASLSLVDTTGAEVGAPPASINAIVSCGEFVVVLHAGAPMAYRVFAGKNDADLLLGDDAALRRKVPELAQVHFVLLASDFDEEWSFAASSPLAEPRWKSVSDRAILVLNRGMSPEIEAL